MGTFEEFSVIEDKTWIALGLSGFDLKKKKKKDSPLQSFIKVLALIVALILDNVTDVEFCIFLSQNLIAMFLSLTLAVSLWETCKKRTVAVIFFLSVSIS